jgi:hypothetical protein
VAFLHDLFYAANCKESHPQVFSHFGGDDRNIDSHFGEYNPLTSSVAAPAIRTDSTILILCPRYEHGQKNINPSGS